MFLIFAGDAYYPYGGANDLVASFSTLDNSINFITGLNYDWWHIFDTENGYIAKKSKTHPLGLPDRLFK